MCVWGGLCFKCGGVGVSSVVELVFQVRRHLDRVFLCFKFVTWPCVSGVFLCFKCVAVFAASGTWLLARETSMAAGSRDIYIEMRVSVCFELGASLLRSDLSSGFSLRFSAPHIKGFRVQGLEFVDHVASTATPHRDARQVD